MKNRIRDLRKARDMTLEELGEAIGLTKQTVGKIENGYIKITADYMFAIAHALNVYPLAIFDEETWPENEADPTAEALGVIGSRMSALEQRTTSVIRELAALHARIDGVQHEIDDLKKLQEKILQALKNEKSH